MKYSLLSLVPEKYAHPVPVKELRLDDVVKNICGDNAKSSYFAGVVSAPLSDAQNIEYRREILRDLRADPALLERLKKAFGRYDRMRGDWIEMRGGSASRRPDGANARASLDAAWASLKVTSLFPGTLLSFVREIRDALETADVRSQGLRIILEHCRDLLGDGPLTEIAEIAEKFRYSSPEKNGFELNVTTGAGFEKISAEISDVFELSQKKQGALGALRRKNRGRSELDGEVGEDAELLLACAMYDLDGAMSRAANELYDGMFGISSELNFYECAAAFADFLDAAGASVFPDLEEPGRRCAKITRLRDLYLLSAGENVVPCDLEFGSGTAGLLIGGENGAGKTTFLRSVGLAYLFCQAGLPVPAETAAMSVRSGLFVHFSSAEEDFAPGDTSGRFEGEARAVSEMLEKTSRNALLLLNETFQTTAYDEGTRAMRGILSVLPDAGIQYLFVTHLTGLFADPPPGVRMLEFDLNKHDYRIMEEIV